MNMKRKRVFLIWVSMRTSKCIKEKWDKKRRIMMKKNVAIIQARMGSSRLPGKVLMPILNRPILYYIVERLKRVQAVDQIIIATSDLKKDNAIEIYCKINQIDIFRGSEEDVLDRYYQAAKKADADTIIRITADCPLIDPCILQKLIGVFYKEKSDYYCVGTGATTAVKKHYNRYPNGLNAEIFTSEALETAWLHGKENKYREHVTTFIWCNEDIFNVGIMPCSQGDFSDYRWTVDFFEDYQLVQRIYEKLYFKKSNFGMKDILDLLTEEPSMMSINQHLIGKEGYETLFV